MVIKRVAIYLALVLALSFAGLRQARADGAGVPLISAPFVTVNVGDTFSISISITGTTDLTSWQFDLGFNPAIVKANSVTEGPFMSSFGTTLFVPGVIDNVTGQITINADSYVDLPPDPSGDGVLANIEFTALAPGVSPLTLSNVFMTLSGTLSDQGFDISNGQITVLGSTRVPEPASSLLLLGGLALLFIKRSWRNS